jgi:hypothetical protein
MTEEHKASEQYLELFKLAVEMADRVSARRATADAFFLTGNTALLARHQGGVPGFIRKCGPTCGH